MDVGLVVPAYEYDPSITYRYLERLDHELSPERIVLEVDVEGAIPYGDVPPCVEVHPVRGRRGKGAAIDRGFDRLEEEVYIFLDDDGSVPPASVQQLIDAVEDGADMAVGSRRHPACDDVEHGSRLRRRMGDVFAWVARRALRPRLYDYQCGAKAVTADIWREVEETVEETGFAWDIDAVTSVHEAGGEIEEVPVRWHDSPLSRVDVGSTALELASALLRLRRRWDIGRGGPDCFDHRIPSKQSITSEPLPCQGTHGVSPCSARSLDEDE